MKRIQWSSYVIIMALLATLGEPLSVLAVEKNVQNAQHTAVHFEKSAEESGIGSGDETVEIIYIETGEMIKLAERPSSLNEVTAQLPETLQAYLSDGKWITLPIVWECEGDYEASQYFYYQFDAKWDQSEYPIRFDIEQPYIGVAFGQWAIDSSLGAVTSNANETTIYNFLKNTMGCNTATACGILANIACESGFKPTASCIDTNGLTSYGICQWNGSRFQELKTYCNNNGYSYSSVEGQLKYLQYELVTSEKTAWSYMQGIENSATGAYTAGYTWAKRFERCAATYHVTRGNLAKNTYWPEYGRGDDPFPYEIDSRYPTPFYAYNLANGNTPAYSGVDGSKVGNIYGVDKCTIQEVYTNGWCKLNCPWDGYTNGRIVYTPLTTFIASGYSPSTITAPKRADVYKRSNGAEYMGYIDSDDTVVKVGESGSYTQTIFPLNTGGYMCAWVPSTNLVLETYTISYNGNGGTGAPGNQTKTQDVTLQLTNDKPNKNYTITYNANGGSVGSGSKTIGCIFRNWNTNANGSGTSYNAGGSYTANATATLYAQWTNPTAGNLETPIRSGYTFAGWYTAESGGSQVTSGTTITGNMTLYAHWNINKYTISYNAHGGSGEPVSQEKEYNTALTLSNTKPTRSGYIFLGWSTSSTATSATYQPGGSYTANGNVTLYAVWKQNSSVISGNVTSYDIGKNDVVTIRLLNSAGTTELKKVQGKAGTSSQVAYEIKDVEEGSYILEVSKEGHVTRTYEIIVGQSNVAQDMKICPKGDVTGDGKVTTMDVTRTNMHARGLNQLSGYELACADVVGTDGKVTTMDVTRINAHVRGISALW